MVPWSVPAATSPHTIPIHGPVHSWHIQCFIDQKQQRKIQRVSMSPRPRAGWHRPSPPAHPGGGADGDGTGLAQGRAPGGGLLAPGSPAAPLGHPPCPEQLDVGKGFGEVDERVLWVGSSYPTPRCLLCLGTPYNRCLFWGCPRCLEGGQAEGGTRAGIGTRRVPAHRDSGLTTPSTCAPGSWASSWGSGKHGQTPRTVKHCPGPCRGRGGTQLRAGDPHDGAAC